MSAHHALSTPKPTPKTNNNNKKTTQNKTNKHTKSTNKKNTNNNKVNEQTKLWWTDLYGNDPTMTLDTVIGRLSNCPPLMVNPNPFLSRRSLITDVFLSVSMSEPWGASNSISKLMTLPELHRRELASLWFRRSVAVPLMARM